MQNISILDGLYLKRLDNIITTNDNGIMISGSYFDKEIFIKTDPYLNMTWSKPSGNWGSDQKPSSFQESGYSAAVTSSFQDGDNNYVNFVSISEGSDVLISSVLMVKLNQAGDEIGTSRINHQYLLNADKTPDGGYVLLGNRLIKLNNNFSISWEKDLSKHDYWECRLITTHDGGFAITGWNEAIDFEELMFLEKTNSLGDILWIKKYPSTGFSMEDAGYDLCELEDGGFLMVGRTGNQNYLQFYTDNFIVRTNESGDTLWTKKFGSNDYDNLDKIIYSSGNEFIISGNRMNDNTKNRKSFLVKIDDKGQILDSCSMDEFEKLIYSPAGYFIKATKLNDKVRFEKIQPADLFISEVK